MRTWLVSVLVELEEYQFIALAESADLAVDQVTTVIRDEPPDEMHRWDFDELDFQVKEVTGTLFLG